MQLLELKGRLPTQSGALLGLMIDPRSVSRRWAQRFYEVYDEAQA